MALFNCIWYKIGHKNNNLISYILEHFQIGAPFT